MKIEDIYNMVKGKFVTGEYTKLNGTTRKFWGRLEYDVRHPRTLTYFDMRKNDFRRISLKTNKFKLKCGKWEIRHDK
jgi:hypothetical protein